MLPPTHSSTHIVFICIINPVTTAEDFISKKNLSLRLGASQLRFFPQNRQSLFIFLSLWRAGSTHRERPAVSRGAASSQMSPKERKHLWFTHPGTDTDTQTHDTQRHTHAHAYHTRTHTRARTRTRTYSRAHTHTLDSDCRPLQVTYRGAAVSHDLTGGCSDQIH